MCGIAGFLNYNFTDDYFDVVNTIQFHRGPDAQEVQQHDGWRLYHERLSIIDISAAANQPFEKNGLVIIFNGEIYNYRELRQQLSREHGIEFRTHSDTEVLLELYRIKKEKCLVELQGMFAFAIYDKNQGSLFLVRDSFGIKPLFYVQEGKRFAFASELKTLIGLPGFTKTLNMQSLVSAMNFLWLPGNGSMFESVHKLPPGSYALVGTDGNMKINSYYKVPTEIRISTEEEAIHELDLVMNRSIDRHLEADVPVSAFLSGGLDSSLLSVMASKRQPLSTYSIAISDQDKAVEQMPDDANYARKLAKLEGFDHHEITINPNVVDELPKMVYHLDEPLGDPAAINTYLISKAAREQGVKVLLSGMGADEMFFGYRRQMATLMALNYQKLPAILRSTIKGATDLLPVRLGGKGLKPVRWGQRFLSFADLPAPEAYRQSYSYYEPLGLNDLFNKDVEQEISQMARRHEKTFEMAYQNDVRNQMCFTDLHYFMQGLNLTYTDRASMAASVEVRVPFIDKEVIETAMSMSGALKYKGGQQKYILKKMAERYLPKEIIYRPKASFGAPIRSWISGALQPMVQDLLNESSIKERGIFNPDLIQKMIKDDSSGKHDYAYQLYMLLSTELWFKEFMD